MSWLFVPGLEASSSASKSPNPEQLASVTWRGKPLPPRGWSRVWRTAPSIPLLSGVTLPPSILALGVDSWISSLRATRASRTASPGNSRARTTIAGSSTESSATSMSCGLLVSSARTSQGTQTGSLKPSSQHWSRWVIALRRESSQRPPLDLSTNASDYSSWPTASVMMTGERTTEETFKARQARMKEAHGSGNGCGVDLAMAAKTWKTPRVERGAYTRDNGDPLKERLTLEGQAQTWMTPTGGDSKRGGGNAGRSKRGAGAPMLPEQACNWPTPTASDTKGSDTLGRRGEGDDRLSTRVERLDSSWPTPAARDFKGANSAEHVLENGTGRMHMDQLPNFVEHGFRYSPPALTTRSGSTSSRARLSVLRAYRMLMSPRLPDWPKLRAWSRRATRKKLNIWFVEWLMGWPLGWTDSAPLAMELSPWLQLMRGELSRLSSPDTPPTLF